MDFIGAALEILKCFSECFCEPASRKIHNTINIRENFETLNKEAQRLHAIREDVDRVIKAAGKRPTSECKLWLHRVDEMAKQLDEIKEEYRGCCPHVSSCMNLGTRVLKLIDQVIHLRQECSEFTAGMMIDEPQKIIEMPGPTIQADTSTCQNLQNLLRCIKDVRTKIVGIWGMGGIGKTAIMKNLNNHPEIAETFEIVIWVTVSKEGSYKNVQNDVAQRLSLRREQNESDDEFTAKLYRILKARKFLLLLDDVWDEIDLAKVGVPIADEDSSCKVVLSTRLRNVCRKMKTNEEIRVEVLYEGEAWALFCKEVGKVVDSPDIRTLAQDVVKECCGLPLAILIVGNALREEDNLHVWRAALNQLKSSVTCEIEDMDKEVFRCLKYSFDRLKHENTRNCFLYCALYPEDYEIEEIELIDYWISEGIIDGQVPLVEARDKGYMMLKELKDASLLEKSQRHGCIKMHDVIRDLALRITSEKGEGYRSFVTAGVKFLEAPKVEEWEYPRRISLMKTDLSRLPEMPNCGKLLTLLLQGNYTLTQIPSSFFKYMCALRVLDLSETHIKSLPPSLGELVSLRGLYLDRCRFLRALPHEVGALTKLEVLHLNGEHQVYFLPLEMGELTSLKDLQLRVCTPQKDTCESNQTRDPMMDTIPQGIFSRLSQLEQVKVYVADYCSKHWDECARVVSTDMGILSKLTCLDLHFAKPSNFKKFTEISSTWKQERLKSFRFFIGHHSRKVERTWKFELESLIFERWNGILIWKGDTNDRNCNDIFGIRAILDRTNAFLLEGHVRIQQLSEFGMRCLNVLKACVLVECEEIQFIFNGYEVVDSIVLPNLEELYLYHLFNLQSIWVGPLPLGTRCLTSLKHLELVRCPKLRNIFPWDIIQQLCSLEYLYVDDCRAMKEIIANEEGRKEAHVNILPKLKILDLYQMQELAHICSKWLSRASWPSLEEIHIHKCPKLKTLPHGIDNAPYLRSIICEKEWWEALEWEGDAIKQKLEHMIKFQK